MVALSFSCSSFSVGSVRSVRMTSYDRRHDAWRRIIRPLNRSQCSVTLKVHWLNLFAKFSVTERTADLYMRVIVPPQSKFHLNGIICSWVIAKKWFSIRRPSVILNLQISEFCHVSVTWVKICVCLPNFVKFRQFAAEIWRYDFQNGGRPPCWVVDIFT